jgi:hypothetical protein
VEVHLFGAINQFIQQIPPELQRDLLTPSPRAQKKVITSRRRPPLPALRTG